jgi:ribosomal protein S18 acetylase RimI-like enzyme
MAVAPAAGPVVIRPATAADADAMGCVGPAAYAIVYAYMWDDSAAFSRQLATFSANACRDFLARPDTRAWVAEIGGDVVGFLKMVLTSPNPVDAAANGAEIPRIYLLPGSGRLGLGRRLMDAALDAARAEGQDHVWLAVKGSADNAHAAYVKWGFSLHGVVKTKKPVKAGYEALRIMIKPIG